MPPKPEDATSSTDFYALLGIEPTSTINPSTLRKAFRRTSLLYHPDKNPSPDAAAKFHLLTIAFDVLSDPASKTAYDNARRVKEEAKVRHEHLDAKRRKLREDLESRENAAMGRQRESLDAEAAFQRELRRLREEGGRLRREREEALRKAREEDEEGEEDEEEEEEGGDGKVEGRETKAPASRFSELDRTVRVRWRNKGEGKGIDSDKLERIFGRFGKTSHCLVKEPKAAEDGKEKKLKTGLVVFDSIVGAYTAVEEGEAKLKDGDLKDLKDVAWAGGKPPDLPQLSTMTAKIDLSAPPPQRSTPPPAFDKSTPTTLPTTTKTAGRKMPSFASFNAKAAAGSGSASPYARPAMADSPDYESLTLLRLRQSEKRRLEDEILRKEEEEEAKA